MLKSTTGKLYHNRELPLKKEKRQILQVLTLFSVRQHSRTTRSGPRSVMLHKVVVSCDRVKQIQFTVFVF